MEVNKEIHCVDAERKGRLVVKALAWNSGDGGLNFWLFKRLLV